MATSTVLKSLGFSCVYCVDPLCNHQTLGPGGGLAEQNDRRTESLAVAWKNRITASLSHAWPPIPASHFNAHPKDHRCSSALRLALDGHSLPP